MNVVLFWVSVGLILYCYIGYPFLIIILAFFFNRPVHKKFNECPTLSVILSVWNEADVIETKLTNMLALDYPADRVEFLIGSDYSTDGTDTILSGFRDPRMRFVSRPERRGKMSMLNDLVAMAKNEILVFSDARQIFAADALRQLAGNFADPEVGCVSGELEFLPEKTGSTAHGVNLYWGYEKWIRACESRLHSMLGATGAIYAIRRSIYTPLPGSIILDDMFIPLHIIRQGFRAVYDTSAKAYDRVAHDPGEEFRRKVRTLAGNYQIFGVFPGMFNPLKSPIAFQLFSHKLLRLVVPFLLILLLATNVLLLDRAFYLVVFLMQIMFYLLALIESLAKDKNYVILNRLRKAGYIPYVFCLLNYAALVGFWFFVTGRQSVTWDKARMKRPD